MSPRSNTPTASIQRWQQRDNAELFLILPPCHQNKARSGCCTPAHDTYLGWDLANVGFYNISSTAEPSRENGPQQPSSPGTDGVSGSNHGGLNPEQSSARLRGAAAATGPSASLLCYQHNLKDSAVSCSQLNSRYADANQAGL